MPHIEFAYNRIVCDTSLFSPFEAVNGFNLLTPMDILPLPTNEHANLDGKEKAISLRSYTLEFGPTLKGKMNNMLSRPTRGV